MKTKNLLILALGILSFIGMIWFGKAPVLSLPSSQGSALPQKTEILLPSPSGGKITTELTVNGLEEQAEKLYQTGRFQDAISLLQQLSKDYAVNGDTLGQARALRNLALLYQQIGDWSKANEAITNSLNLLAKHSHGREGQQLIAEALEAQGLLQLSKGQSETALETWKQAANIYQQIGDILGALRSEINQTQALQRLGLYRQAIQILNQINGVLQQQPDTILKAKGLQSLGDALRVAGELNRSQEVLEQSLAIAQKLTEPDATASTLLSLGNTARLQSKFAAALDDYQKAVQTSSHPELKIQALLNHFSLLVSLNQGAKAIELLPQIESNLGQLPLSRQAINARINFARNLMRLKVNEPNQLSVPQNLEIAQLLATTVQQAESLQDPRTLSYALGVFGRLYEQNKQWDAAQTLTNKALLLAQSVNASDINYRWQWQLGRILNQQGNREAAIAVYNQAVNTLQSIRGDLVATSSEVQFSFKESVEPIYREFVGLLLPPGEPVDQSAIKRSRDVIDLLQLAELDNFFRDACLNTQSIKIDQIDPKAAVFSTIILSDRLEVIVALPNQPLRRYTTLLPQKDIEATIQQAGDAITIPRLRFYRKNFHIPAQKIYDWLISPVETELANSGIQTLVFVLDGTLRNIPMMALYDGEKYLVQKYSVALAPGLQLVDAKPLKRGAIKVLTAGLSEARQGFTPLPGVMVELSNIASEVKTEKLLNQTFTTSNFKAKVKSTSFPIVHLATHGKFSSQATDTFILTWDSRINAKDLDTLLRTDETTNQPVELLVFSACQTAVGDNRATLGLTGVAVRAGARSTVASLWSVDDEATTLLMTEFYKELAKAQLTKAEALRLAQLSVLQNNLFSHPYFWSAFVLVGNWL